ncbi:hypothetical protein HDU80_005811 [Chytriomyces hyalinus]|nr:hypothetical protein HDU80_005811 [Chytriomyces hyalinus]
MDPHKRVAVIGAGMAGLAAARAFKATGWEVTVFEASARVGGVWSSCYEFARLQTRSESYYFGDFPFPFPVDEFATADQLQAYFEAFALHTGIKDAIRFNTKVVRIKERRVQGRPGWALEVSTLDSSASLTPDALEFDFVVSAQGLYSGAPKMLCFPGQEDFGAPIIHSAHLKSHPGTLEFQNIAIVGLGKTAVDCAMRHANNQNSMERQTHLIFRTPTWFAPIRIFGLRLPEVFEHNRFMGTSKDTWRSLWYLWRGITEPTLTEEQRAAKEAKEDIEREKPASPVFAWLFGYKKGDPLRPAAKVGKQCGLNMQPERFLEYTRTGRIQTHRGTVEKLSNRTIHLASTTIKNVDALVLATGFKQTMVVPDGFEHVIEGGGAFLYRGIVHPDIRDMAFIGMTSGVVTVPATTVAVHWLLAFVRGDLLLPSRDLQMEEIQRERKRAQKICGVDGGAGRNGSFSHIDRLCMDMGITPLRKLKKRGLVPNGSWNPLLWCLGWIDELFGYYGPLDYKFDDVEAEIAARKKSV